MFFTQHAIERFRKRFAPALGFNHCLRELKVIGAGARRLDERGAGGETLLEATDGSRMILVVKSDDVCVTVLFGGATTEESDPLEGGA